MGVRFIVNETDCACCPHCMGVAKSGMCDHDVDDGCCLNCEIDGSESRTHRLKKELLDAEQKHANLLRQREIQLKARKST